MVQAGGDYTVNFVDPDVIVDWELIEQVVRSKSLSFIKEIYCKRWCSKICPKCSFVIYLDKHIPCFFLW